MTTTQPTAPTSLPLPPVVDDATWQRALADLRAREKAATRELDAIAAQRRRLPAVALPDYTLDGPDGPVRLTDVFDGRRQLIVYNHMWFPGETWQCGGCTSFTAQFVRLDFLEPYDARFVIVTQGLIDEALAYKRRVGNKMDWYSTANSPFGSDMGAPSGGGFAVNVLLRGDDGSVYRTWHTDGRGTEQLSHTFPLVDLLPYGRQEEWQEVPDGWPQGPTYAGWLQSEHIAELYGKTVNHPRSTPPLAPGPDDLVRDHANRRQHERRQQAVGADHRSSGSGARDQATAASAAHEIGRSCTARSGTAACQKPAADRASDSRPRCPAH